MNISMLLTFAFVFFLGMFFVSLAIEFVKQPKDSKSADKFWDSFNDRKALFYVGIAFSIVGIIGATIAIINPFN